MNINNPSQNRPYRPTLQLHHDEILIRDNIYILNREELLNTEIRVSIRAPRNDLDTLSDSDIATNIDFRTINTSRIIEMLVESDEPIIVPLNVSVNPPEEFEHQSFSPSTVEVLLDLFVRESFVVDTEGIEILTNSGHELQSIWIANPTVSISGPRSVVRNVENVRVEAYRSDVESDLEFIAELRAYTADNVDITDQVTLGTLETIVRVSVLPYRNLDIQVMRVGSLAPGFILVNDYLSISTVTVVGRQEYLDETEVLDLRVDLSHATETFMQEFDIVELLPPGLVLREGEPSRVTVGITIEPLQDRTFSIPRGSVGRFGPVSSYRIVGEGPVRIHVRGPASTINRMSNTDIIASVNLSNREVGIHVVALDISFLLPGVVLIGAPPTIEVWVYERTIGSGTINNNELLEGGGVTPSPPDNPIPERTPEPNDPTDYIEPDDPTTPNDPVLPNGSEADDLPEYPYTPIESDNPYPSDNLPDDPIPQENSNINNSSDYYYDPGDSIDDIDPLEGLISSEISDYNDLLPEDLPEPYNLPEYPMVLDDVIQYSAPYLEQIYLPTGESVYLYEYSE